MNFGPKAPTNAVASWGARAILIARMDRRSYKMEYGIDLLHDRQSIEVKDEKQKERFGKFLDRAIAQARKVQKSKASPEALIDQRSSATWYFEETKGKWKFHFQCSPNNSYGYLYCGAWMTPVEEGV